MLTVLAAEERLLKFDSWVPRNGDSPIGGGSQLSRSKDADLVKVDSAKVSWDASHGLLETVVISNWSIPKRR